MLINNQKNKQMKRGKKKMNNRVKKKTIIIQNAGSFPERLDV